MARKDLESWEMGFKLETVGDTLYVHWDFGFEDPRILALLSFTIRVHPDDYDKVDFPEGKKTIIVR